MEEVALEMSTTAEDAASTFIPLCQQLARDPEPEIRQSAVEQIAPLVRALAAVSIRGMLKHRRYGFSWALLRFYI